MTVPLDGFVADSDGSAGALYPDLADLADAPYMKAVQDETGAALMGRRTFDMAGDPDTYADSYELQVPIFVVTHTPPAVAPKRNERLSFTFVTDGLESAVAKRVEAAGDRAEMIAPVMSIRSSSGAKALSHMVFPSTNVWPRTTPVVAVSNAASRCTARAAPLRAPRADLPSMAITRPDCAGPDRAASHDEIDATYDRALASTAHPRPTIVVNRCRTPRQARGSGTDLDAISKSLGTGSGTQPGSEIGRRSRRTSEVARTDMAPASVDLEGLGHPS